MHKVSLLKIDHFKCCVWQCWHGTAGKREGVFIVLTVSFYRYSIVAIKECSKVKFVKKIK